MKKVVGNQETTFVYDAFGKLVAEYTTNQAITGDGTKYMTADSLGSPRAITDIGGNVVSRHDYMPFGEEVLAGAGGRNAAEGYLPASDGVTKQFTGYEKDSETGLDYAQARYYSGKHGRFTSVDPLTASINTSSPQSFNRYSYVGNDPLNGVDPSGLCVRENGKDDGRPCPDFTGQVYQDANGGFSNFKCDGCTAYTGGTVLTVVGGMNVQITGGASGGWTTLGEATSAVAESVTVQAAEDYGILEAEYLTESALESAVISPRPLIPLLAPVVGPPLVILGTAQTVDPNNCPSNVCPAGTGPPIDLSPQIDIQPDTGQGPATTKRPPGLDPNLIIVRGGEAPLPPLGTTFSGAFGTSIQDAAAYVPHGQIRYSTVKDIVENGGSVVLKPEMTRAGNLNPRHVNVTEGIRSTFSPLIPNPVPKRNRIQ